MDSKLNKHPPGHLIFDHDGTLVNTQRHPYFLFVGMREFLLELRSKGFVLSIWTARSRQSTLESIKKLEIATFFDGIYCYDDGMPKPHPMGLKELNEGFRKEEALHIGDSLGDIEGAHAFGIEVIAACWNDPTSLDKFRPIADYTALNLEKCRTIIKGKFNV